MADPESFFVLYLLLFLLPIIGFWIWNERRDLGLRVPMAARWLYRCPECIEFYTTGDFLERAKCPDCGRLNEPLKK